MGSAPKADPKMGEAALLSAQVGQDMLAWMQGQAEITNRWAREDRELYNRTYRPLEARYVAEARAAQDPRMIAAEAKKSAGEAVADVRQQFRLQRLADRRGLTAMGVNPDSGRFVEANRSASTAEALASAGAANIARRSSIAQNEAEADGKMANAINLGKGLAVNPAQSMGLSNSAGATGFQGAMSGYGQQANILNQDYNNRMQAWQAKQSSLGGLFGGLGALTGMTNGFGLFPASWR